VFDKLNHSYNESNTNNLMGDKIIISTKINSDINTPYLSDESLSHNIITTILEPLTINDEYSSESEHGNVSVINEESKIDKQNSEINSEDIETSEININKIEEYNNAESNYDTCSKNDEFIPYEDFQVIKEKLHPDYVFETETQGHFMNQNEFPELLAYVKIISGEA
jgi:hypothetical protein